MDQPAPAEDDPSTPRLIDQDGIVAVGGGFGVVGGSARLLIFDLVVFCLLEADHLQRSRDALESDGLRGVQEPEKAREQRL